MREEMRPQWEMEALATRQDGVVAHSQLRDIGYSDAAIGRAIRAGRFLPLHRGTYSVGHRAVSRRGLCLAAIHSSGESAMLSHETAAWAWGLLAWFPDPIHVTAPNRGHRKVGVHIHHSTILEDRDRAVAEGVPTTAIPRTLLDLASHRNPRRLHGAVDRAERLDILDIDQVDELLERSGRHRGKRKLRKALEIYRDPVFSRARSERLLLALVKSAGLPRPSINTYVAGHEIDAYWEREKFAVEVDGWGPHRTRRAFEEDPLRQEELKLAGIDSIRVTARRVEQEPETVAKALRRLLGLRRQDLP
jgi:very-short-patch-repair endonuclease